MRIGDGGAGEPLTERDETGKERADRELTELLQGHRVAVTGVQVLLAFLLTVPFSARFASVGATQRWFLYIALVAAALATMCYIAPVAQHRILFRSGRKETLVRRANRFGLFASVLLIIAIATAMLFVVDELFGSLPAALTAGGLAALTAWSWLVQPGLDHRSHQ